MADHQSSKTSSCHCSSYLFSSPKFRFFTSKMSPFEYTDLSLVSPTSILEANPSLFSSKNSKPTCYFEPTTTLPINNNNTQRFHFHPPDACGLADLVKNRGDNSSRKPVNKMVLFGSKLRVQIPACADFGTKTSNAAHHQGMRYRPAGAGQVIQTKVLAVSEVDQTEEDYTRVTCHGPNPTITHIYDNSVYVEATPPCSLVPLPLPLAVVETEKKKKNQPYNFLSYCYTCKKNLDQKQDIFIYRGEKGFCSNECRYQEMLLDDHIDT